MTTEVRSTQFAQQTTAPAPPKAPSPAPSQGPVDTLALGGGAGFGVNGAALLGHFQQQRDKDALVQQMVARDTGLPPASKDELEQLQKSLGHVDLDVLKFAKDRGTKFEVLRPGEDITKSGLLRDKDPADLQKQLPQMRQFAGDLDKKLERYDRPLQEATERRSALAREKGLPDTPFGTPGFGGLGGMLGGPKPDPEMQKLDADIQKLRTEKGEAMVGALGDSKLPVRPFGPPPSRRMGPMGMGGMLGGMDANLLAATFTSMPQTTESMAAIHGATSPAEVKEFTSLVEGINGDRLTEARQDFLKAFEGNIGQMPKDSQAAAREQLEKWKADPSKVPFDHQKHNILVPDLYYHRNEGADGPTRRYDYHDKGTVLNWAGADGTVDRQFSREHLEGTGQLGQYFPYGDVNRIGVHKDAVGSDTPVHELGHAVDFLVEKEDPAFHKEWTGRLQAALGKAREAQGGTVSDYALTNEREYLAEGFAHYYEDPKLLKTKDPALFTLTDELVQRARTLGK